MSNTIADEIADWVSTTARETIERRVAINEASIERLLRRAVAYGMARAARVEHSHDDLTARDKIHALARAVCP